MFDTNRLLTPLRIVGGIAVLLGLVAVVLSPFLGESVAEKLWGVEPVAYLGAMTVLAGLIIVTASFVTPLLRGGKTDESVDDAATHWTEVTQQYFELYHHDLGRPLTRILAKERELRTLLANSEDTDSSRVLDLLDEIERQAPNFRLMLSNIQVLVQLEAPTNEINVQPVEPAQVIRRIVDRYSAVASEAGKEITWWSEPTEFGIVQSDHSAIEHITTNLVDNAVRFATGHVEVRLSKNPTHFFIRVWDDGPGIAQQYQPHIFDRGWTPEVARRDEKVSSGLGMFIARTLARRYRGDITIESTSAPADDHHTAFLATLKLGPTA